MEDNETEMKDSMESILNIFLRIKHDDRANTAASDASPEEGVRLIRAFINIKHLELRAAIIKLATQLADNRVLRCPRRTRR
jgi:hypothetical protein